MRLIDADAITYELWTTEVDSNRDNYRYFQNRYMVDRRDIESMPTVQQWISCSERLPDKDGKYLVSGNWEGKEEVTICGFYTELGRFGASWRFTIKAWMPSPSPWKGADDDERQV